ncbi:MAG TPA: tetratricopeptide repeat protein [Vicinamibacterales bacterium]|nr:tetratricopeptide repeat protein [Vicinamibacterales bacterium]
MRRLLLTATACIVLAAPAGAADWTSLRTEHFLLLGDARPGDIRDVALRFEQFRAAVSSAFPRLADDKPGPPVVVIVFRDQRAYEPYQPRFNGKAVKVGGYFLGSRDVNYITLTASTGRDDYRAVYHEYTHLLLQRLASNLSPWFNEGLAEYFSTFEVAGNTAKFGLFIDAHLDLLSHGRMPVMELFAVTKDSKTYNEGNRRSLFYAQSWLLAHYAFGGNRERWNQLVAFETLLESGAPSATAFQRAFGVAPTVLDGELSEYAQRFVLRFYSVQLDQRVATRVQAQPVRIPEAEAQARLGDLLTHAGRTEEATALLEASLKASPDLPLTHAALGMLLLRQNKSDDAMAHLERAAAARVADEVVQFYYGAALMERAVPGSGDADAAKAIAALEQAVQLRPGFPDAERLLGYGYLLTGQPAKARDALRAALQEEPGDQNVTMMLAEALVQLGQFADARVLLGPVVGTATDAKIKERARDLLGRSVTIEQQQQLRAEAAAERPVQQAATTPTEQPAAPPVPPIARRQNFQPVLRELKAGETRTYGLFTEIECTRGQIVLHVRELGQTLLLRAARFDAIDFISYRSSTPGTISCGPRPTLEAIYVTWRADEATLPAGTSQGIAVAVELLPDGFVPSR